MSIFDKGYIAAPNRNKFDLSHSVRMSLNPGKLYPCFVKECVPGDVFKNKSYCTLRFAPFAAPAYGRVDAYIHYWFVPTRIVFKEFNEFLTGGPDGTLVVNPPVMKIADLNTAVCSLADYMGVPTGAHSASSQVVSAIPFRAYLRIYNDFYRDENSVAPIQTFDSSGLCSSAEVAELGVLRNRSWRKDYFTSCLPWAQRGPEVTLPLGTSAPVHGTADPHLTGMTDTARHWLGVDPTAQPDDNNPSRPLLHQNFSTDGSWTLSLNGTADLSNATAATLNELRRAWQVEKWLEVNAVGGSRFAEQIFAHFGVMNPDSRLQEPEYIGGGMFPVQVTEVLQTSETTAQGALGEAGGRPISSSSIPSFTYRATEHGYILGILSVIPRATYSQGLPRHLQRLGKFDYYWPEFARLGEQAVPNREIYLSGHDAADDATFGYQERYAEMKCAFDEVHGDFRSSLSFWTIGRKFASMPGLNQTFLEVSPDCLEDNFVVRGSKVDHIFADIYHDCSALRPMPRYGTPSI